MCCPANDLLTCLSHARHRDARHRDGGGMGSAGQDVLGWFQVLDHDMSLRGERKYGGGEMETGLPANLLAQPCLPPAKSWGAGRQGEKR